jgi:hypothetical protein
LVGTKQHSPVKLHIACFSYGRRGTAEQDMAAGVAWITPDSGLSHRRRNLPRNKRRSFAASRYFFADGNGLGTSVKS